MPPVNGKRKRLLLAFLLILSVHQIPSPGYTATFLQVVLRDSHQIVWERPFPAGGHFSLVHRNSIYGALVWEGFRVDSEGSIWLEQVKTDSPAVLEYYGLEESSPDWVRLSKKIGRILMLITSLGEVHLEWGEERKSLSAIVSEGTFIEIRTVEHP
jgi:hypothetical protein